MIETFVGIAAGTLTSISMLPQLIKVFKEQNVEDISLATLLVLIAGVALWVVYGFMKNELPIIISNSFAVAINCILLGLYIRYRKNSD